MRQTASGCSNTLTTTQNTLATTQQSHGKPTDKTVLQSLCWWNNRFTLNVVVSCKLITFSGLIFVRVLGMLVWWPTAMKAPQRAAALKDVIVLAFDKCEEEWSKEQFQQCYQKQTGRVMGPHLQEPCCSQAVTHSAGRGKAVLQSISYLDSLPSYLLIKTSDTI